MKAFNWLQYKLEKNHLPLNSNLLDGNSENQYVHKERVYFSFLRDLLENQVGRSIRLQLGVGDFFNLRVKHRSIHVLLISNCFKNRVSWDQLELGLKLQRKFRKNAINCAIDP